MRYVAVTVILFGLLRAEATAQPPFVPSQGGSCSDKAFPPSAGKPLSLSSYADTSIDVTYYRLNLRVWTAPSFLSGSVLTRARCTADSVQTIGLDLMNSMTVDSIFAEGTRLSFLQFPEVLTITLNRSYERNEFLSLEVFYHGTPVATGFGSFEFGANQGSPWVWTLSEPYGARDWWPCKDHPSDKADSVDVLVTTDASLKVGSNGRLISVVNNGDGTATTRWAERYPIATYLVSVTLTDFAEFTNWFHYSPADSMPVINYVLPEHLSDAQQILPKVPTMLSIFSSRYGLYPFITEKYGHTEFGSGGAMEHQTMTSTTTFDEVVIAHELAHQWFGDLITCANWKSLWLNEGFASYSEAVYMEAMYGEAAYQALIGARMALALNANGSLYVEDTTVVKTLFDNHRVYSKGASVLHMLRHILGDTVFFRALRSYVADPALRFGVATTEDFQRNCEQVSGQNLGYFFQEWVYGNGYPRYSIEWSVAPSASLYLVSVTISHVSTGTSPTHYTMPVDLRLSSGGWDTTIVVFNSTNPQTFTLPTSHEPHSVVLDPDNWILREILLPSENIPITFELSQNFPNPFNGGTQIRYSIPHRQRISLKVYTVLGQEAATIVDLVSEPGVFTASWDGTGTDGSHLPSGVYFARLNGERFTETRKMLILR